MNSEPRAPHQIHRPTPSVLYPLHNCHANYAGNAWSRVALNTDYYLQSHLIFHPTSSSVRLYHTRLLTLPPVLLFFNPEPRTLAISRLDDDKLFCVAPAESKARRLRQSRERKINGPEGEEEEGRGDVGERERETYGVRTTPSIRPRKSLKDADA
jgi:hypothetical protein